jgi:MraZ protein
LANTRFRSKSEHSLDEKGRLNIPSRFRSVLQALGETTLMVAPWDGYLRAYPVSAWEDFETKIKTEGGKEGLGVLARYIIAHVTECSLDKQGRIHLPPGLRAEANVDKEVVLTGMIDWVEIWDKERWAAVAAQARDNFGSFNESLARLGEFS